MPASSPVPLTHMNGGARGGRAECGQGAGVCQPRTAAVLTPMTSARAMSAPTASGALTPSGPVPFATVATMNASGIASESTTSAPRATVSALLPPALRSARGHRDRDVVALVRISGGDPLPEAARVALACPRHHDHEREGQDPRHRPDQSGDYEPNRAHHLLPARRLSRVLVLRRAQEARQDENAHDRLVPGSQRSSRTWSGERGGANDFKFRQGLLRFVVHSAQDEEVGGDAGVGRVVPVERRHPQVKPHLLSQEGDVGGHEGDEEWRPCDRSVDPGGADRAPALALGEHGRGAIRCGVPRSLGPLARAVRLPSDFVDRQPLGNVVRIASGEAHQHAGDAQAVSHTRPEPRRLCRPPRRRRPARPAARQARCSSGLAPSSCALARGRHRLTSPATSVTRKTWPVSISNTARI